MDPKSDDNLSPLQVENDYRLALRGYKELSGQGRDMVRKQIARIIAFVSQCEQAVKNAGSDGIPEIELDELDERIGEEEEEEEEE
jgi:hypothetical protein